MCLPHTFPTLVRGIKYPVDELFQGLTPISVKFAEELTQNKVIKIHVDYVRVASLYSLAHEMFAS